MSQPSSEIAADIRARLEELGTIRTKKQQALEAAERQLRQAPDPASAEALMVALPLLDVDWELVSDQDFRALLVALNFEAIYDPTERELTIRVTLVPELTDPDGPRAPLFLRPRRGTNQKGTGATWGFARGTRDCGGFRGGSVSLGRVEWLKLKTRDWR